VKVGRDGGSRGGGAAARRWRAMGRGRERSRVGVEGVVGWKSSEEEKE
jgi:hypothetical protein